MRAANERKRGPGLRATDDRYRQAVAESTPAGTSMNPDALWPARAVAEPIVRAAGC